MAAKKASKAAQEQTLSPSKREATVKEDTYKKVERTKAAVETERGNPWFTPKLIVTVLAFLLRFWRIDHPDQVVFDEVHFGKFASHYLKREYYFDLHPPLAKLMFAAVGWFLDYDGKFKFENIGDNYVVNQVPYIAYRSLAATMGALTVPLVFEILERCGFSSAACVLGASLVMFDTAQITQTRLILLDAALIFFMAAAVYSYVRFREQRHAPFGIKWWAWLTSTGFFLSCVISTKYVGLFTYLMIGIAVLADLCYLADIRGKPKSSQLPLKHLLKHFTARLYALVVGPFLLYLWWFYVHFAILTYSGPGDSHMSPDFQATLLDNPVVNEALDIRFFDTITMQSVPSDVYLHSHPSHYPMQYEDGRISSQGQQVTGYTVEDPNNLFQILPAVPIENDGSFSNKNIVGSQQIMLRHVATDTFLLTHDVASPQYPTNEEFTTVSRELAYGERHEDAVFYLDILSGGEQVRTKLTHFRLKHVHTKVVLWLSDKVLPEWGFSQYEINGSKKQDAVGTVWYFGGISNLKSEDEILDRKTITQGNQAPRRSFWTDYMELQGRMFRSNNQLKVEHPYMSAPWQWPLLLMGISFWSSTVDSSQMYLMGNYVGWYLENTAVLVFLIIFLFDKLAMLREFDWLSPYSRNKLNTTLLWFFLGWAFHYLPFFMMGRQLFLHHYLPAHVIGSLLTAGLVDFITGQTDRPEFKYKSSKSTIVVVSVLITLVVACFLFLAPLAYGLPLSPEAVRAREIFKTQLHFNKS